MQFVPLTAPYIDDDFSEKHRRKLFHYTSLASLEAILKSNVLWATDYRHLNDVSEFRLTAAAVARTIYAANAIPLRQFIERRPIYSNRVRQHPGGFAGLLETDSHTLPRVIGSVTDRLSPMHVTSFSLHEKAHHVAGGILTLWRAYGGPQGLALRFDTQTFLKCLAEMKTTDRYHLLHLATVSYGDDDPLYESRLSGLDDLAKVYLELNKALIRQQKLREMPEPFIASSQRYIATAISHKHIGFEDEREIRLVASPIVREEIEAATSESDAISHLHIACLSALDGIMIGPTADAESATETVRAILNACARSDVEVSLSDIPFRQTIGN